MAQTARIIINPTSQSFVEGQAPARYTGPAVTGFKDDGSTAANVQGPVWSPKLNTDVAGSYTATYTIKKTTGVDQVVTDTFVLTITPARRTGDKLVEDFKDGSVLRDGTPAPKEYQTVIANANAKSPLINAGNSAIFDELAMDPYEVANAGVPVVVNDEPEMPEGHGNREDNR